MLVHHQQAVAELAPQPGQRAGEVPATGASKALEHHELHRRVERTQMRILCGHGKFLTGGRAIGRDDFGAIWALFHILIVILQAYIFMMLTVVYISLAHEHH